MAYYREKKKHTKKPNSVIFSYPRFVNTWALENKNPDKAVFKCFGLTAVVVKVFLHSILWPERFYIKPISIIPVICMGQKYL